MRRNSWAHVKLTELTLPEITPADREARQKWVDAKARQLEGVGVDAPKARRQAAGLFDKENPWYKEGNSRGKQWV